MDRTDDEVRAEWCRRLGWFHAPGGRIACTYRDWKDSELRSDADLAEAVRGWVLLDHGKGPDSIFTGHIERLMGKWMHSGSLAFLRAVLEVVGDE